MWHRGTPLLSPRTSGERGLSLRATGGGFALILFILASLLCASIVCSISIGVAGNDFGGILALFGDDAARSSLDQVIVDMRIPRVLSASLTGAAFSLAGAIMQGLTRNPLADSGLLGINAGASFMITLSAVIVPGLSFYATIIAAFTGAALATLLVYGLGVGKKSYSPIRLILAGAAVSALLSALSQGLALTFGLSKEISFWTAGSLSGSSWAQLSMVAPFLMAAIIAAFLLSPWLSALSLGEETATGLGIRVGLVRNVGLIVVFVLAGVSVAVAGGISFLGLLAPHIARFFVGSDYRRVIPTSMLCGSILLVCADVLARTVNAPFDTPVGALVALIGVPLFLILAYRRKMGGIA